MIAMIANGLFGLENKKLERAVTGRHFELQCTRSTTESCLNKKLVFCRLRKKSFSVNQLKASRCISKLNKKFMLNYCHRE